VVVVDGTSRDYRRPAVLARRCEQLVDLVRFVAAPGGPPLQVDRSAPYPDAVQVL
jgi:hypothetical protein